MQSFIITFYSLYTAMTLGWDEASIIMEIDRMAKNDKIPRDIIDFIKKNTQYFNRAFFYLENGAYYIEIEKELMAELQKRRL